MNRRELLGSLVAAAASPGLSTQEAAIVKPLTAKPTDRESNGLRCITANGIAHFNDGSVTVLPITRDGIWIEDLSRLNEYWIVLRGVIKKLPVGTSQADLRRAVESLAPVDCISGTYDDGGAFCDFMRLSGSHGCHFWRIAEKRLKTSARF